MNKSFVCVALVIGVAVFGCASPVPRPTTLSDGSKGFSVNCNGSVYQAKINWGACYERAATECFSGFDVFDREQRTVDDDMAMRTLYFRCKK